jgi:hypothetical protein
MPPHILDLASQAKATFAGFGRYLFKTVIVLKLGNNAFYACLFFIDNSDKIRLMRKCWVSFKKFNVVRYQER